MKKIICLVIIICSLFICLNSYADAQMFGKNKKQYKLFDWKYIESKHFDVYYNAGSRALADFSAIALEAALQSIQSTLNYKLTQRISVLVYDSHNEFQQTNVLNIYLSQGIGGVTELYKNRVVVPFQGSYEQFRHVLHHELVHAVMNDMFYGGTFQTAVSMGSLAEIPIWISEGLAEWESLGGMNAETDMFMRDLAMNDKLPHLRDISGYLAYRCGQTFFYFIETKYGKGKVTEFMNKLRSFRYIEAAFQNTFGMNLDDFSEMWQTEIKKMYWPDITIYKSPKEFATQLTNHEKDDCFYYSSPAISPNGEKMAFISDKDGGIFAIYVSDIKTSKEQDSDIKRLISSARQQDFEQLNILTPGISWSPDSRKIVISAKSGGEDAIFITDVTTGKYEKILPGFCSISSVNWAPDGNKIAFVGNKNSGSDIYYYDLAAKQTVAITQDVFTDAYPVWSSDSKSIYFISDRGENLTTNLSADKFRIWNHNYSQSDVYKFSLTSKDLVRITNMPEIVKTCISIAADEKTMLLVANQSGISNIYSLELSGNNDMKAITNSANGISHISTTPDGLTLIFSSQIKGGYDVFMINNPYEQPFIDTLPQTNFVKRNKYKQELEARNNIQNEDNKKIETITYGNFKTDFSKQLFLPPNVDAIENINFNSVDEKVNTDKLYERDYEVKFSLDGIFINPAISTFYGVQGNTAALVSDIMGNHQIYLTAYLLSDLKNSQFYGAYSYNTHLIDYSFSLYNSSIYTWNYVEEFGRDYIYSYRSTGGVLGASYAFDLFRRIEFNINLVNAEKNNVDIVNYEYVNKFFVVPELRYVLDNSLNGLYAPTRGSRLFVKALYSPKIADISSEFMTVVTDARHYFEFIPNYMSLALRGTAGISLGANPQKFYLGGVENWINATYKSGNFALDNPEDFAFMNSFLMPLRGWPVVMHKGTKFAMANIEYRFPIFMAIATGGIPLFIQGVMGNIFYDVGAAWSDVFRISHVDEATQMRVPDNLYMSAGWGIRAIIFGLPFKFDMAWRNEYNKWSSPYFLFSIGLDF